MCYNENMKELESGYIKGLINKVFQMAESGKFEIGKENAVWTFYVKFENSKSEKINKGELSIKVRSEDVFLDKIKTYLSVAREFYKADKEYFELDLTSFDEKLIMDLFINATNFDINNIEKFIEQRTEMLLDKSTEIGKLYLGEYLNFKILGEIKKNKSNLEAPFRFDLKFKGEEGEFILPSVAFGVEKDTLKIYSLQGEKIKQTNKAAKFLDRHFRKANKDVDIEDEILSQVSTNALVALTVFLAYQKTNGFKNVQAINYMPIRYNSNLIAGLKKRKTKEEKQEFEEIHNRNQFNISNKFFNTIIRYVNQFELDCNYDDVLEVLNLTIRDCEKAKTYFMTLIAQLLKTTFGNNKKSYN